MNYSKLQTEHRKLLEKQELLDDDWDGKVDISEEAIGYIKSIINNSQNIYNSGQRDNLRANIRYWAAYIRLKRGDYPDNTDLKPIDNRSRFISTLKYISVFIILIVIGALLNYGVGKVFPTHLGTPTPPSFISTKTPEVMPTNTPVVIPITTPVVINDPIYIKWGLYVSVATVFILIVLMFFMWRKMLSIAQTGGATLGKIAGEIRRTIVGGGKRGKPLAGFKVLDGPPNMVGQELKVYTESVKLGRNPQLADMTFYAPDVITSVSGLHARLEKISGAWRIVALSQSGSETFIDDQPIPFNEPIRLSSGQRIRLGYFAQQPVILEFQTEYTESRVTLVEHSYSGLRKTNVKMDSDETEVEEVSFYSKPNKKTPITKKQSSEDSDSVFDEFR